MKKNVFLMGVVLIGLLVFMAGCGNPEEEARVLFNQAQTVLNDNTQKAFIDAEVMLAEIVEKYPETVTATEAGNQLDAIRKIIKGTKMINEGDVYEAEVLLRSAVQITKHPIIVSTAEYLLDAAIREGRNGVTKTTRKNETAKRDGEIAYMALVAYWADNMKYPLNLSELMASEIRLSDGVFLSYSPINEGRACLVSVYHEDGDAGYFTTSETNENGFSEMPISAMMEEIKQFKLMEKKGNIQVLEFPAPQG